jgi:hypothetical protein
MRVYEGDWANGKKHGFGTFTNHRGISRKGKWVDNVLKTWVDQKV